MQSQSALNVWSGAPMFRNDLSYDDFRSADRARLLVLSLTVMARPASPTKI
jgi:hypothetical protein